MEENILVSGGAGFIGSHVVDKLLLDGCKVYCIDNFDPFYPKAQKIKNQVSHFINPNFQFTVCDLADIETLKKAIPDEIDCIIHLAAKAGVRPSIQDPLSYQRSNVAGTQNLLEVAREKGIKQFVFASSSSVYGINPHIPWKESDHVLLPISPYASTKVSGELLGHTYSHLFGIRFIALRLFSVYGPRQRPDLAIYKFMNKILQGEPIPVFGDGSTSRDYTYVEDIVEGIEKAIAYQDSPYEIINLGSGKAISLSKMIGTIEEVIGLKAKINRLPIQPGDVPQTYADISKARELLGYQPKFSFQEGVLEFKAWLDLERRKVCEK